MEAKPRSLKDIFDTQCRYMVPLYQRPYVWRRADQWEPLWEDIQALAERYYKGSPFRPHFMGAVVLEQISTSTGTLTVRQIIDGQQRLSTLQILIEAAADVCETLGEVASVHAQDLRDLTRNHRHGGNPDEVYKVWPTNIDRDHFRRIMSAQTPEQLRQFYNGQSVDGTIGHSIADAYIFFYEKINEWLNVDTEEQLKHKLDALQNALYNGLIVVIIDLDQNDDAQMIFETLNARGTPLLASDLVKNYLLQKVEEHGHNLDTMYAEYWEFFDKNPFWRSEVRTGRFNRPHIEVFLQFYLTVLTQDEVMVGNLFNIFRQHIRENSGIDPAHYLNSLHHYGSIYHQIYSASLTTREGLFLRRIRALDTTTVLPILLIIFDKLGKPEFTQERHKILTDIESFLVRRMICGLGTKNYNNVFLEIVKRIHAAEPLQINGIIRTYLLSQTADISRWPDDKEFEEAWHTIPVYEKFRPQDRVRMVLEAIELQRRTNNRTEDMALPKKALSIEHILPRQWTQANWPLPEDSQEARDARQALLHTFGNLTLVTGRLNSSLSNAPWQKKKDTLQKYSILLLNADLIRLDQWSEAAIRQRSKDLLNMVKVIWPVPAQ